MDNPLDLKLLMNQTSHVLSSCNTITALKAYKCDHCNTTYSDKTLFEMHKASHLKETNSFTVVKEQQMSQIVMTPGSQIMTTAHPTHQQQQQQQQQHITSQMPIMIQEPDLSTYKKTYTPVEPQQVYTLVPMSQYQTMGGNNRVINVGSSHDNQGSNPSFATPMYIVISTPEGQQLQPITEIVQQQDPMNCEEIQGQILRVNNPMEVDNITRGPGEIQLSRMSPEVTTSTKMSPEIQVSRIAGEMKGNRISNNNQLPTRITNRLLSVKERPFKCDQCTASFIESSELDDHKKKHTGDGPFTCEDCHFTFMYKSHFRSHKTRCQKKKVSLTKPTIFSSSSLKRKFPTNHIKQEPRVISVPVNVSTSKAVPVSVVHPHPIRNQPRQVSSKQPTPSKFNPNKPSFKRIKRETNKERPYECQECDASFCTDADLNTHRTKHTGEGPFKCDDCKFVFLYRKLYEAHKRRCDRKKKDTHILPQDSSVLSSDQTTFLHQDQRVLSHQQYILPEVTNRIYSSVPEGSAMQLIQPSILEMRPAGTDGSEISNQAIIEQVAVSPSNLSGRQEYKYEVIPTMDGVNVNQIMNLIKVKDQ